MVRWVCFRPLFFNLIRWIQLGDKKSLQFVDCCDKILLNSSWKTLSKSEWRPSRTMFVYKIQVNPIHTILKYCDYYDFMDR